MFHPFPKVLGIYFTFQWGLSIPHLEILSPLLSMSLFHRAQFPFLLFHFPCHFLCPYSSYKGLPSPLFIQHFLIPSKNDSSFILKLVPSLRAPAPCRQLLLNSMSVRSLLLILIPKIRILIPKIIILILFLYRNWSPICSHANRIFWLG